MVSLIQISVAKPRFESGGANVGSTTSLDYRNPERAQLLNIKGYIDVTSFDEQVKSVDAVKGQKVTIMLSLKYVSHIQDEDAVVVTLDPIENDRITIEQVLGKDKGIIKLNDLIEYTPKVVALKPGESRQIQMTIRIPEEFLDVSLPLPVIGIESSVPILVDKMEIVLNVH